jgi:hypothetical protein
VDNFYAKQNPAFEEGPELWAELMPFFWEVAFYKKLNDL